MPELEQIRTAPTMLRAAETRPASFSEEDNSVEVVWSTGAAVTRFDWWDGEYYDEILEMGDGNIRLERMNAGAPLLNSHNMYSLGAIVGSVVPGSARIEGGKGICRVRLATTDDVANIVAKVKEGHIRNVSVGYQVHVYEIREPGDGKRKEMRATDWEPLEVSLVAVPADPDAQLRARSAEQGGHPCTIRGIAAASKETEMPDPVIEPAADPAPATPPVQQEQRAVGVTATRILELCARSDKLGSEFAAELVKRNEETPMTEADLLAAVNERLLEKQRTPVVNVSAGATGTEDAGYRAALETAVILRADPSVKVEGAEADAAREFRGMTLMEMARDYLQRTGVSMAGMGRLELAGAALGLRYGAMGTSDFANALSNAAAKRVRSAYEAAPQTFGPIVSRGTLPDFKETSIIGLGDAPALLLVKENAEFTYGAISDTGMTYRLQTYGRIIAITRQAIVNDDKQLFGRIPTMFGRKAADLESDLVWGILTGNPVMADGTALFHANHANLAGSGGAINVTTVGAAEQAMLTQTNPDGNLVPVRAAYLIVGPAKAVEARQFLSAITATKSADVNPFPGTLQLIVEPRITGNQWFLAADPAAFDTIELSHLDGQEALYTETQVGFDVDGVKTKARLDVGAAAIDWRGFYKNPGA